MKEKVLHRRWTRIGTLIMLMQRKFCDICGKEFIDGNNLKYHTGQLVKYKSNLCFICNVIMLLLHRNIT